MDSESLRIFCTVAVELSITQAAARLQRAPSNVSTRIQQLESELGVALFVRARKRLSLSPQGRTFHDYALRLLGLEAEARQAISADSDGAMLRIGSMESTAASRLPALLAAFQRDQPQIRLTLGTAPSRPLIEQVHRGLLDCAFVALPPVGDGQSLLGELGLQSMPAWQEQLQLLLPPAEPAHSTLAELEVRTLLAFPEGCSYRAFAEQALAIGGTHGWSIQVMASYHAMIACVAAGNSCAVLPHSVIALGGVPAGMRTLPLAVVETWLIWRQGYRVPAFEQLRAALMSSSQSLRL